MRSLQVLIRPETLGNANNNNTTLLPFRQGFGTFFTDLEEAFNDGTKPLYLVKFAPHSDVIAIALCYALYKEKLTPTKASYNEHYLETTITAHCNHETSLSPLDELSGRIKDEVLNLVSCRKVDMAVLEDLIFEIKLCPMDDTSVQDTEKTDGEPPVDSWEELATEPAPEENRSCFDAEPPITTEYKDETSELSTSGSSGQLVSDLESEENKSCCDLERPTITQQHKENALSEPATESWKELASDLNLNENNRLFPACKSCYNLKPPIIIQQLKGNSECSWCKTSNTVLLHEETYQVEESTFVEYSVVRKYTDDQSLTEVCRYYQSVGGHCPQGDSCNYAHNPYEKKFWEYVKELGTDWNELTALLSLCFPKDKTTSGVFHCVVCQDNFSTGGEFSHHCDSLEHRHMSRLDRKMQKWKYRQPPNYKDRNFYLCKNIGRDVSCPNGDSCTKAHSAEELEEWNKRIEIFKEKQKFARDNQLLPFAEQVSQEYDEAKSNVDVLTEVLDGVQCEVKPDVFHVQRSPTNGVVEWHVRLYCSDTQNHLNHVALLQRDGHDYFKVCKIRGRKKGPLLSHIDYTTATDDCNNLLHGFAKFKVRFSAPKPGTYSEALVFEFRKQPRPCLMVKFQVLVGDNISISQDRSIKSDETSWVKTRRIDAFSAYIENDFEEIMLELMCKYKPPEAALDYKEDMDDLDSKSLTTENYVKEMHKFLYREEAARRKAISKLNCSCTIGLSKNYFSMNGGLCFVDGKGGLFGIFKLPGELNRDTDEGLLILENCDMVYLAKKDSNIRSTVYESKIETIAADHIVLNISKSCVETWDLQSGRAVVCDLQFQLDRRLFCMSHAALDQLPDLDRLTIVCPESRDYPSPVRQNASKRCGTLDSHQNRVLEHLTSKRAGHPLFAVVGPFGTGKTFTISQCVLYLLENCPGTKILICTHSNSAADLYIQSNFTDDEWDGKIIRVYYHERSLKSVPNNVHRFCLKNDARTQFRYPTTQEILKKEVRVVITTFATALALGRLTTGLKGAFSHIFLDEAAQAMECEAIIPLTLAVSNKTKVIVAGDHMQISQKIFSKKFGSVSDYTLVERMYSTYKTFPKPIQDDYYVFLTNNYRCVEPILDLIQNVFYKPGLLTSCTSERCIPRVNPLQFFHIKGKCCKDQASGGYYNVDEANLAVFVVGDLLNFANGALEEDDIAVVSSYAVQVQYIRKLMRNQRRHQVKVDRIRNVQGREFKVVIMSCVHSRTSAQDTTGSTFGLLADVGLLNTAITRSKVAVIAIGDAVTLCSIGECRLRWDRYVKMCHLNGSLLPKCESYQSIKFQVSQISTLNPEVKAFLPTRKAKPQARPKTPVSPASSNSSLNNIIASGQHSDAEPFFDSDDNDEVDEEEDDKYEHEDTLARVDDKILDDILEKQLGYRPDKIVIKVDDYGLEYLDTKDDPNEPAPDQRNYRRNRPVIHQKYTIRQLQDLLRTSPKLYKHCCLHMVTWYSAEAILKEPEEGLTRIMLSTKTSLGRAFNKDEVVVSMKKTASGSAVGSVIGVLSRYKEPRSREFICIPDMYNSNFMCPIDYKVSKFAIHDHRKLETKDNKICVYRFTKNEKLKFLRCEPIDPHAYTQGNGKLFIVRYLKWSEYCPYPFGYVSKVISAAEAERYFAITYDRPLEHTKKLEKDSQRLSDANAPIRKDCTNLFAFTIDPPGSKDLDDALSIEKCTEHAKCYEIGVHIADVASVVPLGSDIDKEAKRRATTFYDPDTMKDKRTNSPMLPRSLSSDKCSLLAGQKRPVISTFFHTSQPLDVTDSAYDVPKPQLAMIQSRRQMNYKEAEDYLREARSGSDVELDEISGDTLPQQLHQIWLYLLGLRFSRLGTSALHQQPDNKLNEFFEEASAHMLIEEAMITLNACTAIFLMNKKRNFLLRCQDPPVEEEYLEWINRYHAQIRASLHLTSCANRLRQIYDDPEIPGKNMYVIPEVLNKIKEALQRGDIESALIYFSCDQLQPSICPASNRFIAIQRPATLKTSSSVDVDLPPAMHSHFDLRLPFYSWCSSPIRRYTDIIAQREIVKTCKAALETVEPNGVIKLETRVGEANLDQVSKQFELRHNDAKEYERELSRYTLAKLFQDQEERYYQQAVVTEVTNREILFCLVNQKRLSKATTHLEYSPLMTKRSEWKLLENVKPHRSGEKILEKNKLTWHFRYYDLKTEEENMFHHPHFDRTIVPVKPVLDLVKYVSTAINSGTTFGGQTTESIAKRFKSILGKQRKTQQCPAKTMLGHTGPCDGGKCDTRDSTCEDHMSYRSKNNIRHVRIITMDVEAGLPLLVQLNPKIHRGMLQPTVQLLCLAEDFDVCLTHQRDAVGTFASDVRPAKVRGEHRSMRAYAKAWLPVLRLDGVFNAVKEGMSVTFSGVVIKWTEPGEKGSFVIDKGFCDERIIHIHPDGFICIRIKNRKSNNEDSCFTWVAHALITGVVSDKKEIEVGFRICNSLLSNVDRHSPVYLPNTVSTIEHIELQVPHRRMAAILQKLRKSDGDDEFEIPEMLCHGDIPEIVLNVTNNKVKAVCESVGKDVRGFDFPLNTKQRELVRKAMRSKLSLIQGPPGTGKSLTGAYMVYYFRQLNKARKNNGYILYCGPSNKSVDVVAGYLMKTGLRILRVYGKMMEELDFPHPLKPPVGKKGQENPSRKLDSITLHKIIRKDTNSHHRMIREFDKKFQDKRSTVDLTEYRDYKSVVDAAKEEELARHDVIICTCTASYMKILRSNKDSKQPRLRNMSFSHCIIDEAGMCSEPETLVPIVASLANQVVLIGDHQQLQPVIQCERAREFGMGVSMFERLHEEAEMLTQQYRMHETICRFPSKHFYDNKLVTDSSVINRDRNRPGVLEYPVGQYPKNTAVFAHMNDEEDISYNKFEHGGINSKYNKGQARAAIKILVWLHSTKQVPLENIMILSPYEAQRSEIKKIIETERSHFSSVHVGTVVTSQGSERDYVILSTVRSPPLEVLEDPVTLHWKRKYLGFITDAHQVNVAITRAKRGLCIIGNKNLLWRDSNTWEPLMESYEARGSVVNFQSPVAPWNKV